MGAAVLKVPIGYIAEIAMWRSLTTFMFFLALVICSGADADGWSFREEAATQNQEDAVVPADELVVATSPATTEKHQALVESTTAVTIESAENSDKAKAKKAE